MQAVTSLLDKRSYELTEMLWRELGIFTGKSPVLYIHRKSCAQVMEKIRGGYL
jgi:hypothetical protein